MSKSISLYLIIFISIGIFISMAMSESYKEPSYSLINKKGRIEIRQYDSYIIAKTSTVKGSSRLNNNMFRVLAGYIFGGNSKQESIPMTTPVITKETSASYDMIFFMLDASKSSDLPAPNSDDISIEEVLAYYMGKNTQLRQEFIIENLRVEQNYFPVSQNRLLKLKVEFSASFGRQLEYYTGMVFKIDIREKNKNINIVNGGRYDKLIFNLGSKKQVPAVGAALNLI